MQQHSVCNPLGIIRTSIKTQAPVISMSCCFRMGKSKRKQAAQPVAVAAPTSPELSPSRKENQKPVQLTKLSFKRTRSSQVMHRHSTKIIRFTHNMSSTQCGAFLLNFCGFLPPADCVEGKGQDLIRKSRAVVGIRMPPRRSLNHVSQISTCSSAPTAPSTCADIALVALLHMTAPPSSHLLHQLITLSEFETQKKTN
jgi:hypothetical protein